MDQSLNGVQKQTRRMVETLAEMMAHGAREQEAREEYPWENLKLLSQQGLMGLLTPAPLGGAGADFYTFLLTAEAIAKACPATALIYTTHVAASLAILALGSDEQRSRYLKEN